MILSLPAKFDIGSPKTADQRHVDTLRSTCDLDWAPRAGSQPRTLAMCCERCVYGSGDHRKDCDATQSR